jgi:iron complex outermembrane receptor protein
MNSRIKTLTRAVAQAVSAGVAATMVAAPVLAQQAQRIEKIEVTGSNIKRIEGETALPVTVISRDEIQRSGVTTAAELLDRISAATVAGYALAVGVGDSGTPGLSAASLRGLGSTNTLILLNGRRLSNYAFNSAGGGTVNLNQIPLAAVERVEVLKDGASAIYGTDAIGGVINFILRKDYQGAEVSAYGTRTEDGGGNTRKYTGTFGFGDLNKQRFNAMVSLDYQKDTPLKASQRKDFAGTAIRPDLGFAQTSGNVFPANFTLSGGRGTYTLTAHDGCIPSAGSYQVNAATGVPAPRQNTCRYDFTSVLDIFPPAERKAVFARGVFQITNDHQAFVEYHLSKNEVTFASSETPINDFVGNGPFIYPAGGRYYPGPFVAGNGTTVTPTGNVTLAWRGKQTGLRTNRVDSTEDRLLAGLTGVLLGWDYNTAFYRTKSKAEDNYIDGWMRESVLNRNIRTGNIDVFSGKPQDALGQRLLDEAKILQVVRESEATTTAFDGRISKELMEMRSGPLALALGFEHRKEEINDNPASVLSSGDVLGGGGNQPAWTSDRKVTAFFGEMNIPILKNLEASVALRYDDYSDFGSTTNPKVGLRWTPTPQFLVRANYGHGFRAPTLADMHLPRFFSNTADVHSDPIRCPGSTPLPGGFVNEGLECDAQFQNQLGGNNALTPEKSKQWSIGFIFEPVPATSFSVDIFTIHRRNSLGSLGDTRLFDVLGAQDPLAAQGRFIRQARVADGSCVGDTPGAPTPANVPCAINYVVMVQENLGKYTVTGADFSASTRVGPATFRFDGSYIARYRYQFAIDGPYVDNVGAFTGENYGIPRWRHNVQVNYRTGPFGVTVAQNFILGYRDASGTRRVGSFETFDVQGNWEGWRGLGVTLGVKNLLDRHPPASDQGQSFQVGYDPRIADPHGRTYYVGLRYKFW